MLVAVYPAPLGLDVPASRPIPHRQAPLPLPAGGQFKPERAGRRRFRLAGGGTRCRQKTAAVRGRGPSFGAGLRCIDPPQLTAPALKTRAGARRCRPRVPLAARASSLPPSTAAMVTAIGPRLQRGLFAPAAAVVSASAWLGDADAGCAAPRSSPQLRTRSPGRLCEYWRAGGLDTRPASAL